MTRSLIESLIDPLLAREGGYVDHPDDRGGETCWGITVSVARDCGYDGPMQDLPRAVASRIYQLHYWTRPKLDLVAALAPAVAAEMFDTGVNMGPAVAARFLQRALNAMNRRAKDWPDVTVDGQIGPATLRALERYMQVRRDAGVLARALDCLQGARYITLAEARPASESFVYGGLATRTGKAA